MIDSELYVIVLNNFEVYGIATVHEKVRCRKSVNLFFMKL